MFTECGKLHDFGLRREHDFLKKCISSTGPLDDRSLVEVVVVVVLCYCFCVFLEDAKAYHNPQMSGTWIWKNVERPAENNRKILGKGKTMQNTIAECGKTCRAQSQRSCFMLLPKG